MFSRVPIERGVGLDEEPYDQNQNIFQKFSTLVSTPGFIVLDSANLHEVGPVWIQEN